MGFFKGWPIDRRVFFKKCLENFPRQNVSLSFRGAKAYFLRIYISSVGEEFYQSESAGKTFVYKARVRGSANIGSATSRHLL